MSDTAATRTEARGSMLSILAPGLPLLGAGERRQGLGLFLGWIGLFVLLGVCWVVGEEGAASRGDYIWAAGLWIGTWVVLGLVSRRRWRLHTTHPDDRARSLWTDAMRRLRRNRMAVWSGLLLILVIYSAVFAPWLTPYSYEEQLLENAFAPPSFQHPFGTDFHGRDLLTRVLYGGRLSIAVGIVATIVSLTIGVFVGAFSGYIGGKVDEAIMRFVDVMYSLPYMFLVILLITVFGRHLILLFVALGAVLWLTIARIVRGQVLSLKEKEFVESARAMGARTPRILAQHLVPNLMGPVIVYSTLTVPAVMLQEAFLSFLGLGVQPPQSSWGLLAAQGAQYINALAINWWLILFPSLALALTLFCLNFLGDGLRDALDPRLQR